MASEATQDPERLLRSARLGAGCLTLFALPFLLVGVFAAVEFVRMLITGDYTADSPPWIMAVFALAFGGTGTAMIAGARYGSRKLKAEAAGRAAHPGEPWLWRADWAQRRVRSEQGKFARLLAVFAFLWCVISSPALFFVPEEVEVGNTLALFGLLFPIVGVGLVIAAVRLMIRGRKYGGTELELDSTPIVPGRSLEGTLHTRFPDGAPDSLVLRLTCIRRTVTGTGKNSSVQERVLWQDERRLEGVDIDLDFGRASVPIAFDVPVAAPSTTHGSRARILWRLDVNAETPGVDYAESFELPVFEPGADVDRVPAATGIEALESRLAAAAGDVAPVQPDRPTIAVRPADPVGTEFVSQPNPGRASSGPLLFFLAVWWAAVIFMAIAGAPALFPILFGAAGLVVLRFTLALRFGVTRTVASGEGVTVRTSVLGMGHTHRFEPGDIADIKVRAGMSQGGGPQSVRAWHRVMIRTAAGRQIPAARFIPTRGEAEWVAAELRRLTGLA